MNEFSRYIICLLAENDCVILPGLGGFIAHYKPAKYHANDKEFVSPKRVVGFNQALTLNDGLLVQAYMEQHGINYPDASRLLEQDIAKIKQDLHGNGKYCFEGLGVLSKTPESTICFESYLSHTQTPELFGLPNLEIGSLKNGFEHKATPAPDIAEDAGENHGSENHYRISLKKSFVQKTVAVVAAIIIFCVFSSPINTDVRSTTQTSSMIGPVLMQRDNVQAPHVVKESHDAACKKSGSCGDNTKATRAETPEKEFTIVLASAVTKKNALGFIESLKAEGYTEAEVLETKSMRRVVYSAYNTEHEARIALNKISKNDFAKDAWILKLKQAR